MTITQAIAELLKRDKSVAIPYFGTLTSTSLPAKINVVTNHFTPPCSKIDFVADNTLHDDKLAKHLSKTNDISIEEADRQISDFVRECNTEFQNYNKIYFEDLGRLARKYDGSYEFELNDNINLNDDAFGLPDFYQYPILRNEVKPVSDNDTDYNKDNDLDKDKDNDLDQKDDNDLNEDHDQKEGETAENETITPLYQDKQPKDEEEKKEDVVSTTNEKTETEQYDITNDKTDTESTKPEEKKRRKWPWILLLLLLLMCAGFVALTYFELIPNYIPQIIKPENKVQVVIGGEPRAYYHFEYTEPEDTTSFLLPYPEVMMKYNDSIQRIADSIAMETENIVTDTTTQAEITPPTDTVPSIDNNTVEKPEPKEEPVVTEPTVEPVQTGPKYLIVCGCFSVEENAQKKVNQLLESGYPNAFYKKRGSMWNAYYDTYSDKQEAKQALDEIRATVNAKAWLLETKK